MSLFCLPAIRLSSDCQYFRFFLIPATIVSILGSVHWHSVYQDLFQTVTSKMPKEKRIKIKSVEEFVKRGPRPRDNVSAATSSSVATASCSTWTTPASASSSPAPETVPSSSASNTAKTNSNPSVGVIQMQPTAAASTSSSLSEGTTGERFINYNGTAPEWKHFKRSEVAFSGRKHKGQCKQCGLVIKSAELLKLRSHILNCSELTAEQKAPFQPSVDTGSTIVKVKPAQQTITQILEASSGVQEQSDYLLAMAFVSSDLPYRYRYN